jgi:hypothetical protein
MSDFGTAALDLAEKADFRPLFPKPVPKLTEFWNRLTLQQWRGKIKIIGWGSLSDFLLDKSAEMDTVSNRS